MNTKLSFALPQRSIVYLIVSLGVVFLILFAGILPYQRSLARLDEAIGKLRSDVAMQRDLYPIYLTMQKLDKKTTAVLPMPPKGVLSRGEISKIPATVRAMAARAGMIVLAVSPDLTAVTGNITALPFTVVVRGDFLKFRKFLQEAGAIPYVDHVEEIQIQENPEGLKVRTKIWFVLG